MVILRSDDQYLLLQRAKAPNQGLYVPVGGKLEPHEDPYTTAKRETLEETGIRVDQLRYAGTLIESSPTAYNWWCNIYWAEIPWQPAPPCDEGRLAWIPYAELADLPTPPTDWHIYQFLLQERPFALNAIYDADLRLISMVEEITGDRLV